MGTSVFPRSLQQWVIVPAGFNIEKKSRCLHFCSPLTIFANPDMAGIRPKIKSDGIKDFVIKHEADRGMAGFINLSGIESPGLTASHSIAKYVKNIVDTGGSRAVL